MTAAIRVLIADDHGVVAEGLRYLIEAQADMEVIGCVADGREAIRASAERRPDVIVMDIAMPELNGTEATRLICERQPQMRVMVLSMFSDSEHVLRALQAGATGYVLKKSVAKDLVDAIRSVHGGRRYLSRTLVDGVLSQVAAGTAAQDPLGQLSSRERQVLQMLAEGHAVTAIAATLSLSAKTVETYRSRMMNKLGIHDLAGLVRFAIRRGVSSIE
ncbi:MAG: response regulator transcription factor [Piscinibacter sp.]|nr:response regulator transcription factor [Piscinibacter sp.]